MCKMKLNTKRFAEYIKENGITKARLNKKFHHIPENTELWFGLWCKNISTYIHHIPENTELWFGLWYKNISTYDENALLNFIINYVVNHIVYKLYTLLFSSAF